MRVRERRRVAVELHPDPIARFVLHHGPEVFQEVDNPLEVNIGADGVCK